jgi:hypothetical protein
MMMIIIVIIVIISYQLPKYLPTLPLTLSDQNSVAIWHIYHACYIISRSHTPFLYVGYIKLYSEKQGCHISYSGSSLSSPPSPTHLFLAVISCSSSRIISTRFPITAASSFYYFVQQVFFLFRFPISAFVAEICGVAMCQTATHAH